MRVLLTVNGYDCGGGILDAAELEAIAAVFTRAATALRNGERGIVRFAGDRYTTVVIDDPEATCPPAVLDTILRRWHA